ncbi:hypothetical protein D3C74_440990 [compost metagenome]
MIELVNGSGELISQQTVKPSKARIEQQKRSNQLFGGVHFAEPLTLDNHPVMQRKRTTAVEFKEQPETL